MTTQCKSFDKWSRFGGGHVINAINVNQFGTEVCLEKDREIYHAKSKPCGDMAASIFDW